MFANFTESSTVLHDSGNVSIPEPRLDLEEKEAALPKRQRKDLKSRLWRYMDWLTLCDSKKAQRTAFFGWNGLEHIGTVSTAPKR